ncbi:lipopolysaccharide biosynthesis protein [Curtobacterium sp. MCPF17_002]|uniref:lipopolysaccharide biosynthesis protein n=1 Tax=Curtobacterium sp. MCPF17_002 TaxID=2175645 RepID=UPI0015E8A5AC|nr:lipopolysaccharide biosynthesis protein [Curtobacterium sp. MCPF17_002]WIB78041.1 lipopolysaccharide biosynthesis protein [Curtobacterium sp. MCPF17_002]
MQSTTRTTPTGRTPIGPTTRTGRTTRTTATDWSGDDHLAAGAVRGGVVTAAGTALRFAAQLAGTIVLARLLGPAAYGFAAVSVVLAGLAELVRAGGLAALVARAPRLDGASATTLHLLSTAIGVVVAGATALAAPAIASAMGFPGQAHLVVLLALSFVPAAVVCVPAALLVRNLRFGVLAGAELIAIVLGVGSALVAAAFGAGPLSLALQPLVFCVVVAVVVLARSPWKPSRPARLRGLRRDLGFAANVSGVQVLTFVSRNVDRIVVGTTFGPAAAGLYAQASQLLVLPLEQLAAPLQRVAVPVLARVADDRERFVRYYRRLAGVAALVLWPLFVVLAVVADHVVAVLFGPAWAGSVPIFRILAVAGIAQTVGYVTVWVFIATGQGTRQTVWALISRPLVAASCLLAVPFGVTGMATAVAAVSLALVVPGFLVAGRHAGLRLRDLLAPLAAPALVAVAAGATAAVVVASTTAAPPMVGLVAAGSSAVAAACVVVVATTPLRRDCRQILALAVRRRRPAGAPV